MLLKVLGPYRKQGKYRYSCCVETSRFGISRHWNFDICQELRTNHHNNDCPVKRKKNCLIITVSQKEPKWLQRALLVLGKWGCYGPGGQKRKQGLFFCHKWPISSKIKITKMTLKGCFGFLSGGLL